MAGVGMSFDWRDRNVLVTGATGLLGGWLTGALLARGANVTVLVRDRLPHCRLMAEGLVDRVAVVHGGVEDFALMLRALNEHEIDTVFHLAAQTIVGTAARSVLSTFESNVQGTWCLLEACRQLPSLVRRVIVASSDKAYGVAARLPYAEDAPLAGRYPYDVSKSCADLIARAFHSSYGVPVVVTRCGNLFGGGDLNWNRIVPGTIRAALRGERPVVRSDGTLVRDYFYVEDAVDAYLLLAEQAAARSLFGEAFNFGTGAPVAVLDLVRRILAAAGRSDLEPDVRGENAGEIPAQWLDTAKSRRVLGWQPQFALGDALARTVDWYRAHLHGD